MLITPEDLHRLAQLEIEREGDHDVVWACRLARKLAWLKPQEASFEMYMGLINGITSSAYILRHDKTQLLQQSVDAKNPKFEHQFSCQDKDAFLCVRPYVVLDAPKFPELVSTLERYAAWEAKVNGKMLDRGWMAEILVGLDGYGVRRKPYVFRAPAEPIENVFAVGVVDGVASVHNWTGQTVSGTPKFGVFIANGAKLEIELALPGTVVQDPQVKLSIGLVSAMYTTRAN